MTDPDGFVFRRPANYPRAGVDLGDWRNYWRTAFEKCQEKRPDFGADRTDLSVACKPGRHFHGLRSLAVTTLASLGLSWQVISMLTGHKNLEMIDHYNRPGKDQFAEGMRKYDNHLRLVS